MLTREQMEAVIREGGTVSLAGRYIQRLEDLPDDAALALAGHGSPVAAAAALDAEIARLQQQRSALAAVLTPAPENGKKK